MKRYLLDTNVVSELIRATPVQQVIAWFEETDEDSIFISVGTLAELKRGVHLLTEGKRRQALDDWLVHDLPMRFGSRIFEVDQTVASAWGRMSAAAQRSNRDPSEIDALLAATAKVHDCVIVTRDAKDFFVFDVEVIDPWQ